jgi:hypothetical protein
VAKKARTPAPPRKVQAPQRREQPRAPRQVASVERQRRILYGIAGAGLIALAIVLGVIFGTRSSKAGPPGRENTSVVIPNLAKLPGAELGKPPWPPEEKHLKQRASILGIPANPRETLQVHYHASLDIYDDGKKIPVPALVGISIPQQTITALHTHDESGFIHIESPFTYDYTLGQFFGIWGLRLSKSCIGGLCATKDKPLRFWVNGKEFKGDPTRLILEPHQVIVVTYGSLPSHIRKTRDFSPVG